MKKEMGMILVASFLLVGCVESSEPQALEEIENDTVVIEETAEVEEVAQVDEELVGELKCPTIGFMEETVVFESSIMSFNGELIAGNHCIYDRENGESKNSNTGWGNCAETFEEEFNKHEYSIVNDCLYKGEESVFEKPLSAMMQDREFLDESFDDTNRVGYYAYEWARGENDSTISIHLSSSSDCGGCAFPGAYLEIDKETGEISKQYFETVYHSLLVFSDDRSKAIGAVSDDVFLPENVESSDQGLAVYDFAEQEIEPLNYEVPESGIVFECGMGSYLSTDSVKWVDKDTVSINPLKKDLEADFCGNSEGKEFLYDEPVIIEL